jgi:hypothetical protein
MHRADGKYFCNQDIHIKGNVVFRILTAGLTVVLLLFCANAQSSAWIGTQDKQLHYDLQTLAEWGYLNSTVTTFPIPWKGVAEQIETLQSENMPAMPSQALARL